MEARWGPITRVYVCGRNVYFHENQSGIPRNHRACSVHARSPVRRGAARSEFTSDHGTFVHPQVTHGHMNTSVAIGLLPNISIRRTVAFYGLLSKSANARRANGDSYTYKPVHGHLPYDDRSRICAENPGGICAFDMRSAHRQAPARGEDGRDITGARGRWQAHLAKSVLCPCFTTALCKVRAKTRPDLAGLLVLGAGAPV